MISNSNNKVNILQYLWSNSPRNVLIQTKLKIDQHIKDFETEVKLVDRKRVRKQNMDMIRSLNAPLKTLNVDKSNESLEEVDFPITTVDMYRNYSFVGRVDIVERMTKFLLQSENEPNLADTENPLGTGEPRCCILRGIGGVGKTQTALEYSFVHRKKYDAVFWLPAGRDTKLKSAFADIARKLKLVPETGGKDDDPKEKVEVARKWLEKTGEY
jgi:hypothetical protein